MPRNGLRPIQVAQAFERRDPLDRVSIAHEGNAAGQQVAGHHHFLLRQVHDHISARVTLAEEIDVDIAVGLVEDEAAVEGNRRQHDPNLLQFFEIGFLAGERRGEPGFLLVG